MDNSETKSKSVGEQKTSQSKQITMAKTFSIAIQFAFVILLPLLAFGSLGQWLADKHSNKLWLIGGLLLALTTSTIWFYRKIADLYKDFID